MLIVLRSAKVWAGGELEAFLLQHPYVAAVGMIVGAPVALLLALGLGVTAIMAPFAWVCGWQ